jgi:hypothetical protein
MGRWTAILCFAGMAGLSAGAEKRIDAGRVTKVYIDDKGGFASFVAAAFVAKHVPLVVTLKPEEADYVLQTAVTQQGGDEKSGLAKLAECAFALCYGLQVVTVELLNSKHEIAWAYNVRKIGANNFQSSAEAIAKHLKAYLKNRR